MNLNQVPVAAFDSGLLSKEYHERLLLNAEAVCAKAGVPVSTLWSRLSAVCPEKSDEYNWVRDLKRSEDGGLLFLGKQAVPVEEKMRGIIGVCLRNYTDARMLPVQEVVRKLKSDEMSDPSVLLIPNFSLASDGKGMKDWQSHELLGLLITRATDGRKTVLYADSWESIENQYGASLREHIETYYAVSTGKHFHAAQILA